MLLSTSVKDEIIASYTYYGLEDQEFYEMDNQQVVDLVTLAVQPTNPQVFIHLLEDHAKFNLVETDEITPTNFKKFY